MEAATPHPAFIIRPATPDDIGVLARQRCAMFHDMGELGEEAIPALTAASARYFGEAMPGGEYYAWLVSPAEHPETIIAGGGIQLRRVLPRPAAGGGVLPAGRQGLVVNVYTEPAWRRHGLATLVMQTILAWTRDQDLVGVVLHASSLGRALYEGLGFVATNEMRYAAGDEPPA